MKIETLGSYGLLKSVNILEAPKREEDGQAAHLHVNNEAGLEKFAKDRIAECLRNTDAQNVGIFVKKLDGSLKCYLSRNREIPQWIMPPQNQSINVSVAQIAEQLPITHIGFLVEEEENIYSILEE